MKNLNVQALFIEGKNGIANYIAENFPGRAEIQAVEVLNKVVHEMYTQRQTDAVETIESTIAKYIIVNKLISGKELLPVGLLNAEMKTLLLENYPSLRPYVDIKDLDLKQQLKLVNAKAIHHTEVTAIDLERVASIANVLMSTFNVDEVFVNLSTEPNKAAA